MTEAVNFSFVMPSLGDCEFARQYVEHTPPVGLPLPEPEFELRDGEVLLRSPDLTTGHWEDPAATVETVDRTHSASSRHWASPTARATPRSC
ncbi:hypothetical protein ACFYQA_35630 [Streptomyces sp. NPDC005774]|uniref:hypothetical protein n=1 Tax=Streptomyces sp. NPDC005774 TaxID=3364728 RepID=UPI003680EB72